MEQINIAICDILNTGTLRYRVIYLVNNRAVVCQMDISKLVLHYLSVDEIKENLVKGEWSVEKDEENIVIETDDLEEGIREKFIKYKACIQEISSFYGPTYIGLMGKGSKPEAKIIMEKYDLKPYVFWKIVRMYLQSGGKDSSLVDKRAGGLARNPIAYNYTKRAGRPTEYGVQNKVIVNEAIRNYFDEALIAYKKGRQTTYKSCYEDMIHRYFMKQIEENGQITWLMMPDEEIPSFTQFYNYARKKLTSEGKDKIRTSITEQRNNKRLLLSDAMKGVHGPGDTVEIDALETDISLVSERNREQTIGRGILYLMVDVWTRAIIAMSVSFENNSVLGCTNLLMNLADDKQAYAKKYGIDFSGELWPSNIIPRRIRVDRGADFRSDKLSSILNGIGIERLLEPAAMGSYKPIVEQEFRQIQFNQNDIMENQGLIEKRHDSNHHREAKLTINEFTAMCINYVLTHNQKYLKYYKQNKKMQNDNIPPIPVRLWEYGCEIYGSPRPIADKAQYIWNLLTPAKASLNREGLKWKNLFYLNIEDKTLLHEMYEQQSKIKRIAIKYDPRDIGAIYYLRDGKLMIAPLNPDKFGNEGFSGMTYKEYEEYSRAKKKMDISGDRHNRKISINERTINRNIVDSAKSDRYADNSDMREERDIERNEQNRQNALVHHLKDKEEEQMICTDKKEIEEISDQFIDDDISFEEALRKFNENI